MLLSLIAVSLLSPAPQAAAQPPPVKPKLICREGEQQLGSHMHADRVCKTAEQWDADDSDVHRRLAPLSVTIHHDQNEGVAVPTPQ
jgi:hypothetical protein